MLTTYTKWVALVASVLFAGLSWSHSTQTGTLLVGFVVWAGIVVCLFQALAMRKYAWATAFVALGIAFNPVLPIPASPLVLLGMRVGCVLTFAASLTLVHATPRLTIQSITEITPRSESL